MWTKPSHSAYDQRQRFSTLWRMALPGQCFVKGSHTPFTTWTISFSVAPPNAGSCQAALGKAIPICHQLGLPIAPEKVEGPSTTITFLGIEIDSVAQVLRLPDKKLNRLRGMLAEWEGRRSATKHQLQSLIGHLSHASKVVKPGRTFMREVIRTMSIPRASHHLTRLNAQCRADLAWWSIFLASWNGISLFPGLPLRETITGRRVRLVGVWGLLFPPSAMVPM